VPVGRCPGAPSPPGILPLSLASVPVPTRLVIAASALALAACGTTSPAPTAPAGTPAAPPSAPTAEAPPRDVHSYARPEVARVTHVSLDLDADFADRVLRGTATLDLERAPGATEVVLDTRDLTVSGVATPDGAPLAFRVGAADPLLGAPLLVTLPAAGDRIVVSYATSPGAAAVQWLTPEQTSSGRPFLFTQGQAILTRTWIPTQDSPGIRQTYEARITVPATLTAVMSAEGNGDAGEGVDGDRTRFAFRLDRAVPPYLIALAIGDLEFRPLGDRAGVWAEPQVVDAAASEFVDVERMIAAAEALYGPYRWGRYDLLVLPPSFPFGGMENPLLTFATPTILAGDRSLVALVAHELAHSWSGNLVTNATWDDFWLNEGFTSYFENRIMEAVYGRDYADMLAVLARTGLDDEMAALPPRDTHLRLDLAGRDPDDGMTAVAYDKGALFLRHIEAAAGRERFDRWLRGYFDRHAFGPMTTDGFLADLETHLIAGDAALRGAIDATAWIDGPGVPAGAPAVTSAAFARVDDQVAAFNVAGDPSALDTRAWSTHEWLRFLGAADLTPARMAALDAAFRLTGSGNSEIAFAWFEAAIAQRYEPAFPAMERFLTSVGRRKFVRPLFAALAATDWGRPMAERIYRTARSGYHAVTAGSVDAVLGLE